MADTELVGGVEQAGGCAGVDGWDTCDAGVGHRGEGESLSDPDQHHGHGDTGEVGVVDTDAAASCHAHQGDPDAGGEQYRAFGARAG